MLKHGAAVKLCSSEGCTNHAKKEEYVGAMEEEEGSTVMLLDAPTMPSLEEFVGVIEQSSKSKNAARKAATIYQGGGKEDFVTMLTYIGRRSIELKN